VVAAARSLAVVGASPLTAQRSIPVEESPYTRMMKTKMAKECRISGSPFTACRWQGKLSRWKETIVCASVAREKNICQSCLNDLEYGVSFHVRDHIMDALGVDQVTYLLTCLLAYLLTYLLTD
jgi:hypothetical protein